MRQTLRLLLGSALLIACAGLCQSLSALTKIKGAVVDAETGEFAGVFTAVQPSDSDMGGREVVDIKITGELYGRLEEA